MCLSQRILFPLVYEGIALNRRLHIQKHSFLNKPTFILLVAMMLAYCSTLFAGGDPNVTLRFLPVAGQQPIKPGNGRYLRISTTDSVMIETLRFYISNISFLKDGRRVWTEPNSFHLIDASDTGSLLLLLPSPKSLAFDQLQFTFGIDSMVNAKGVGSGDLDPMKGMYWAWQSGYINFKLEGTSPACNTRKHAFQYHLGGFLNGNACAHDITLPANAYTQVQVDIVPFLSAVDLTQEPNIMTPGVRAMILSNAAVRMFSTTR